MKYAPTTLSTYSTLIERFIAHIGNRETSLVNIIDVVKYFQYLKKRGYAESSIAYMMISIRVLFKFIGIRGEASFDYQLISIPKYIQKSHTPVEPSEIDQMLEAMPLNDPADIRNRAMISFLFSSGVRVSELCDLKVGEMNIEERYANIISKKNRVPRMVFWDTRTGLLLHDYLPLREGTAASDNLFICFKRNKGMKMTTRSVERIFKRYRVNETSKPHGCRHGFGMRMMRSNVNLRNAQVMLGHKSLSSSERYLRTYNPDLVREYQKLDVGKK